VRTRTGRDVTAPVPEVAGLADVLGRCCQSSTASSSQRRVARGLLRAGRQDGPKRESSSRRSGVDHVRRLRRAVARRACHHGPSYRERPVILEGLDLTDDGWVGDHLRLRRVFHRPAGRVGSGRSRAPRRQAVDTPCRPGKRSEDCVKIKTSSLKIQHPTTVRARLSGPREASQRSVGQMTWVSRAPYQAIPISPSRLWRAGC